MEDSNLDPYRRVQELLQKHSGLIESKAGANALALLTMRVALRAGDPAAAIQLVRGVPADSAVRDDPEFNWMLASAYFVSRQYDSAEAPLLKLYRSTRSTANQKAAAAYGLCGVYAKTGNASEQLRFALWLHSAPHNQSLSYPVQIDDQSIYWAVSGWDLATLLDSKRPRTNSMPS